MADDKPLTCDECGLVFGDLIDGNDETPFHRRVKERLETHEKCERCFETYRKTTELCRAQLGKEAPTRVADNLLSFLRKNTRNG